MPRDVDVVNSEKGVENAFLGFIVICAVAVASGAVLTAFGNANWGIPTVIIFVGMPLLTMMAARRGGRRLRWAWRSPRSRRTEY